MTQFNVPHVQTVLKSTSSAVQTPISRLEQSQSWNFTKVALTKITAKRGWTPCYKLDRMCIHNHFWPTTKGKYSKIGGKCTILSAVILTLGWFLAVSAHCGMELQIFFPSECSLDHPWSMSILQFFTPMHTAGSKNPERKKQSNHVKSGQKLQCAGTALWWAQNF